MSIPGLHENAARVADDGDRLPSRRDHRLSDGVGHQIDLHRGQRGELTEVAHSAFRLLDLSAQLGQMPVDLQDVLGLLHPLPHVGHQLAHLVFGRLEIAHLRVEVDVLLRHVVGVDVLALHALGELACGIERRVELLGRDTQGNRGAELPVFAPLLRFGDVAARGRGERGELGDDGSRVGHDERHLRVADHNARHGRRLRRGGGDSRS